MFMKRKATALFAAILCCCNVMVAQTVYTCSDSIRVEEILQQMDGRLPQERICGIASLFLGVPYVPSTLDSVGCERLVVNTRQMDCTTFVETTVALALTEYGDSCFDAFCMNLMKIRYRNACCGTYSDRLHYISQWVDDNEQKGIVEEVAGKAHVATQELNLNFMSTHPQSYAQLNGNDSAVAEIAGYETAYRNLKVKYIPKELLDAPKAELGIEDGDILAIVTAIKGLDVTHVGFANWKDGCLHLIHASSSKGMVVMDAVPLYDYMKGKKNNLGIRVIRVKL